MVETSVHENRKTQAGDHTVRLTRQGSHVLINPPAMPEQLAHTFVQRGLGDRAATPNARHYCATLGAREDVGHGTSFFIEHGFDGSLVHSGGR
jgi:hypothetical protein